MIIELWTLKVRGKSKGNFTHWKTIHSDHIPEAGRIFIYTTRTGKHSEFRISHIEYEWKWNRLRAQVCLEKKTPK